MPPFAEKESSLLAKLKKSKPQVEELENAEKEKKTRPTAVMSQDSTTGASLVDVDRAAGTASANSSSLVDIFGQPTVQSTSPAPPAGNDENDLTKLPNFVNSIPLKFVH